MLVDVVISKDSVTHHSHKARDARTLNFQNIVEWGDKEVMSTESESQIGEAITLLAFNRVLSIVSLLGTNFLVEKLSESRGESDQGSSGIKYDTSVFKLSGGITQGNGVKVNLPISLASQWNGGQLSGIVRMVDTTKDDLGLLTIVGVTKIESKNWLVKETLINHVVEWRWDLVDRDGIISETQNTVKAAKSERKAWLFGGFGEDLILDLEVANSQNVL